MDDLEQVYNELIMEHSMNSYNKKKLSKIDFSEIGIPYERDLSLCGWITQEQFKLAQGIEGKLKQMIQKKELWNNDALSSHNFAWFNLGTPDIYMALIAGGLYLLQAYLSTRYLPDESNNQMKYIMYISPIMIFIVSLNMPAALPLYWSASAIVLIIQQYISNKYFNYHEEEIEVQTSTS